MREIEFLPEWYPQMRRQKRLVALLAWLLVALLGGLGCWGALAARNVHADENSLAALRNDMSQTDVQLQKLDELLKLQKQWRQQAQIYSRLGLHVEASRLLSLLEGLLPKGVCLTEVSFQTEEQAKAATDPVSPKAAQPKEQPISRRLKVTVQGVAPTDVDLANFLAKLGNCRFLQNVSMAYARERSEQGHILREFEVTFYLDLDVAVGG